MCLFCPAKEIQSTVINNYVFVHHAQSNNKLQCVSVSNEQPETEAMIIQPDYIVVPKLWIMEVDLKNGSKPVDRGLTAI